MGLPRFETCCGCVDLKTGNLILGILNAMFSFSLFVVMIVISTEVATMENDTAKHLEAFQDIDSIEENARLSGLYAMSVILVFMYLAKFLFDLVFIYGVFMERASIIKAYYIVWIVFILLSMFTFFVNSFYYGITAITAKLIYIGINVYLVLVSHSFYVEINMREMV